MQLKRSWLDTGKTFLEKGASYLWMTFEAFPTGKQLVKLDTHTQNIRKRTLQLHAGNCPFLTCSSRINLPVKLAIHSDFSHSASRLNKKRSNRFLIHAKQCGWRNLYCQILYWSSCDPSGSCSMHFVGHSKSAHFTKWLNSWSTTLRLRICRDKSNLG